MFGNHGLGGLPEEGAHEKSPKCLDGNLGDFGEFCKGLNLCIHQSRKQTHNGIVEQNVETHVGKGGHFQFQMARHPAHVGKLASSTRSTSGCPKRNGRVGTVRYGYALRTFSDRPSDSSCRSFG